MQTLQRTQMCPTVIWLDPEWPEYLQKCLGKLWEMYEIECTDRIKENCEHAERYYKLAREKREAEETSKKLLVDLSKTIEGNRAEGPSGNEAAAIPEQLISFHKKLRMKAERQKDILKEEKTRLEQHVVNLSNDIEASNRKLQRIKDILDS